MFPITQCVFSEPSSCQNDKDVISHDRNPLLLCPGCFFVFFFLIQEILLSAKAMRVGVEERHLLFLKSQVLTKICLTHLLADKVGFFLFIYFLHIPHGTWDLSSPTRDRTCGPSGGSAES